MLILSRRETECICLGDDIVLTIVAVGNDKVRIGVKAPPGVRILRNELEVHQSTLAFPSVEAIHGEEFKLEELSAARFDKRDSELDVLEPETEVKKVAPLRAFRKAA